MENNGSGGFMVLLFMLAVTIFLVVSFWKVFTKAGKPGWASLIPLYNIYVLLTIVNRPGWWFILMLIPLVNFVIMILVTIDLAKRFGKGGGFAAGLIFLPFIFYPILGLGDSRYSAA